MSTPSYIIEIQPLGKFLRIRALDVASLTEILVMAPRSMTKIEAQALAVAKLKYVLSRSGRSHLL